MVESVKRALALLEALNASGMTSVHYLHQVSGLPKSTIVRLLGTLCEAGYVTRNPFQHGYQLTSRVQSLSSGFHGGHRVIEAGRPLAIEYTRMHKWPVAIGILDGSMMVVRFTTTPSSPISPRDGALNMRLNLLTRAIGRAYLAFCSPRERDIIIEMLKASDHPEDAEAHDRGAVDAMLGAVRRLGFAVRSSNVEPKYSSTVAAPILHDGHAIAAIGMTFFRSALTREKGIDYYAPLVKQLAADVSANAALLAEGKA